MANATATVLIYGYPNGVDQTFRSEIIRGSIEISSGTYPAGGLALSWILEPIKALPVGTTGPFPQDVTCHSVGSSATGSPPATVGTPSGYTYLWDSVNGNLHIYQALLSGSPPSSPLTEFTAGETIPTAVVDDIIQFIAYFSRN